MKIFFLVFFLFCFNISLKIVTIFPFVCSFENFKFVFLKILSDFSPESKWTVFVLHIFGLCLAVYIILSTYSVMKIVSNDLRRKNISFIIWSWTIKLIQFLCVFFLSLSFFLYRKQKVIRLTKRNFFQQKAHIQSKKQTKILVQWENRVIFCSLFTERVQFVE